MPAQAFFRVHSSLLVLGGLTFFAPLIDGGTTHFPVLLIRLVLLAAFTRWLMLSMKTGGVSVEERLLFLVMAAFGGWALLSVILSPYVAPGVQWLLSLFTYAAMLVAVLHCVKSIQHVRSLIAVVLGMGLFEAAVGLYQYAWTGQARPTGTFFNANFFASYEVAVFAVAFGILCYRRRSDGVRWEVPFLWCTAAATAAAVVLAQSRGALLAFVAAVTVVGLYRFGKVFLGIMVLCLLVGAVVPNPLHTRLTTIEDRDPYAFTRLEIWKSSLQRIAEHPWGVGMGLYKYASFQYRFPVEGGVSRYGKRAESAHNEYLQMAVELGVVGLVLFLAGLALLRLSIVATLKRGLGSWEQGAVIGISGGLLGFFLHAGVDSVFHEPALVLLILLFVGMILALKRLTAVERAPVWVLPLPYHPARVALVGVFALMMALAMIQPAAAWYAYEKGEGEAAAGRDEQALAWFQRATLVDPGTASYRDAVALAEVRLYHRSGDPQRLLQAVEELQAGLELNPLDARFAHRLGTLHVLLADRIASGGQRMVLVQQAASFYEQAIRLDPYSPFNYLELGKIRRGQGRVEEARACFRQATSYEPNFLPARLQLAELSLALGETTIAASEYDEILKVKERFKGRTLNSLERQYLEIEPGPLRQALAAGALL